MTSRASALLRRLGVRSAEHDGARSSGSTVVAEFGVSDMVCEGCAENIDSILRAMSGVRDVEPSVSKKRIRVRYEPGTVDRQQLKDRLIAAGFTPADA